MLVRLLALLWSRLKDLDSKELFDRLLKFDAHVQGPKTINSDFGGSCRAPSSSEFTYPVKYLSDRLTFNAPR